LLYENQTSNWAHKLLVLNPVLNTLHHHILSCFH